MSLQKIKFRSFYFTFSARLILLAGFVLLQHLHVYSQDEKKYADPPMVDTVVSGDDFIPDEEEYLGAGFLVKDSLRSSDSPFQLRKFPKGMVDSVKKDEDYWYADYDFSNTGKKKNRNNNAGDSLTAKKGNRERDTEDSESSTGTTPLWLSIFLWVLIIGCFVGAIIWFLANSSGGIFGKRNVALANEQEEEIITENIFEIKYDKQITQAEREGNYRLAVRLYFLRLLRDMADKNIIRYRQDKTNFDYLAELYGTKFYTGFFTIVRHFEYAWYGEFSLTPGQYEFIKDEIKKFTV